MEGAAQDVIANYCSLCPTKGEKCVPGRGSTAPIVLFCGEAPGKDEEKSGKCWVGKAGKELENYITIVSRLHVPACYLTNLCKFHPANDRDPTQQEIEACSKVLEQEVESLNPKYIAALGAYSTKYFLGSSANLERVHGIPIERNGRIIVPIYHPAAGLHNTSVMIPIMHDFEVLGRVVRGQQGVGELEDEYPENVCAYELARSPSHVHRYLDNYDLVSIDTESVKDIGADGLWWGRTKPWCMSISVHPGTAMVVMEEDRDTIKVVTDKLGDPRTLSIIHNIMYDLPILEGMGIAPRKYYCTMVMAYLTQSLPQGLKDLAYRLAGMRMDSYDEMVERAGRSNASTYLDKVSSVEWPDTEPELVWERNGPRVKKGWPLHKRVRKILADYEKKWDAVDIRDRWNNIEAILRRQAELKFGMMPIGDLSEIETEKAVRYSARDADATIRIFPDLKREVERMNIDYGDTYLS